MRTEQLRFGLICFVFLIAAGAAFLWYREPVVLPMPPIAYGTTTPLLSPERLIIPKIGVDANVQHVGITKAGNMAVPNNYTDVGWYRLGSAPGDLGNAVIAGHLDTGFGRPAVFLDLDELIPGDEIIVRDASGEVVTFVVERLATYDYTNAPMEEIFGTSTEARLNLITCDGLWDPDTKSYSKRLVVFTKAGGPLPESVEQ
jgi:sortase A